MSVNKHSTLTTLLCFVITIHEVFKCVIDCKWTLQLCIQGFVILFLDSSTCAALLKQHLKIVIGLQNSLLESTAADGEDVHRMCIIIHCWATS